MSRPQMATVVFSDLVDYTSTMVRLGPRADELRHGYFALLRAALAATGGREVKTLGDGVMASYEATAPAVAGAVEMQRAIARYNRAAAEPLAIRVGMSAGDVSAEEGDLFGVPVVEAARLCRAAEGGEILASDVVRALAGDRTAPFMARGELELHGLSPSRAAWQVAWEEDDSDADAPLPGPLERSARTGWFVGREPELSGLAAAWRAVQSGERRCVLLAGEPGIGKTRLAAEYARRVQREGALVLLGRCDAELSAPFAPIVEALRRLVAIADADVLGAHVAAHGGEIARLVPELARRVPGLPAPRRADPDTELLRLHEAVVDLLDAAAARRPLLMVVDDLHLADRPSLVLLRHVLRADAEAPMLLLATLRDVEADQREPLRDLLPDLSHDSHTGRVDLGGLDEGETVELLNQVFGHPVGCGGAELARELHGETDGNPLFTTQLVRHLVDARELREDDRAWRLTRRVAELVLPGSVREVVDQRVHRLGEEGERILRAAAVLGTTFDVDVLRDVTGSAEDSVLEILDAAAAAAICSEDTLRPGRWTFAHALVEHALAARLGTSRRRRLHAKAADALEKIAARCPDRLGELAHHRIAAGDPEPAIAAAVRAGDRADALLAPHEVARWYRTALDLHTDGDPRRRIDLLIRAGDAERRAGSEDHREHLVEAAREARRLGDAERLARAALANNRGMHSGPGAVDAERTEALEAALAARPQRDAVRARLLATLASELFTGDHERRRRLSDEALAVAR